MKKLLLILLLILSSSDLISGQTGKPFSKTNLIIGGSISYYGEKVKGIGSSSIYPFPAFTKDIKEFETDLYFGYFIINHLALGLKTDILILRQKEVVNFNGSSSKDDHDAIYIGPFMRYATNPGFFFEVSYSLGKEKTKTYYEYSWTNYSISTGIGYSIFVSKSVAIEPQVKYKYLYRPETDIVSFDEISNEFSFTIGFQIYLQFQHEKNNP
jgi:hypothetical protein